MNFFLCRRYANIKRLRIAVFSPYKIFKLCNTQLSDGNNVRTGQLLPCVPLNDVSVFVSGDDLRVQGVPHQRGHLRAVLGNGQVHDGFVWIFLKIINILKEQLILGQYLVKQAVMIWAYGSVSKFPSVAFQATSIQGDRASEAFKSWFMLSPLKIFA